MQELQIEAAVYQEAVHKISKHMTAIRPEGFIDSDNIWDIYAEQFAPDATPDEIETFVDSFPDLSRDQESSYRLLPAHAVQFYGAVAVRATANNPELQEHSTQKLATAANYLGIKKAYASLPLLRYTTNGLSAGGKAAEAIKMAKVFSQPNGNYDPEDHIISLRIVAESFKIHGISATAYEDAYWQLAETALHAYAEARAQLGKRRYPKPVGGILCHTMTELYAHTDKQRVSQFCEEHELHTELVAALHAAGEPVPTKLLDKAIDTAIERETMDTIKTLAQICIERDDEPSAHKIITGLPKDLREPHWIEIQQNVIARAAKNGDFDTAVKHINKIKDIVKAMDAINILNDALVANGDIDTLIEVGSKLTSRISQGTTFSRHTARMAIFAGDTGRALELVHTDPSAKSDGSWWRLAYDYIDKHVQDGAPESISVDVVCNFLETTRLNEDTDMSFVYAQCFERLHEAGQLDLARELATRFQTKPHHLKSFTRRLQPLAIRDVIASGNWLEAMHGNHLEDPEGGLILSRDIILIAGGIHRARTRRKQTQAIESSSNNLL